MTIPTTKLVTTDVNLRGHPWGGSPSKIIHLHTVRKVKPQAPFKATPYPNGPAGTSSFHAPFHHSGRERKRKISARDPGSGETDKQTVSLQ